ncbi:MAG TPA: DNA polymerase Y family protein [Opitutus sp.]|nr:DNA polymerase Y family protein [Opitutus sp.]
MFAVLHVTDFPLQAVLRIERGLAAQPVALLDAAQRPPVVLAGTTAARASGVEAGQTAPQAMARCEGLVVLTRREDAEAEARAGLFAAAFSVSPQVEDTAPGRCTIDVTALAGERREPAARAAVARLAELGLSAAAGLAATPLLAGYVAQHAGGRLRVGKEREFLRDLPLAVAEPSRELTEILAAWGVRTLGELTALAKADVAQRLGAEGVALWERAAGGAVRPLKIVAPARTFAAEMALEPAVETLEPLLFVLRRFIDRLALELRNAGFVAGELQLALALADETVYTREFRLPEPTTREEILFRVLHTHLETLHTKAEVCRVALECRPVRPRARQQGLFDSALRDPHGFNETLARVAAVIGADRVGVPVVENSHRPDAVRVATPAAVVESAARPAERRGLALRRWRPALAATVELKGAAPAFVWTAAVRGTVKAWTGPWRGSGEWWDAGRAWRREEWDVELESGGVYRLGRGPEGWFLEGEYD